MDACGVDVIIPSKINNKEVVTIGSDAFNNNQLESVVIENSNVTFGCSVFDTNLNLTTIKVAGVEQTSDLYRSCAE